MAGYGSSVRVPAEYAELTRVLLRAAQRRGRALALRVRYKREDTEGSDSDWLLEVDGNGAYIAAWAQQLERELPIVAEGYTGPGAGANAVRVATSFVARWVAQCVGRDDEPDRVRVGTLDPCRYRWSVIDVPELEHVIGPRLWVSDAAIALWIAGDLPDELAVEEVHTAVEAALRHALDTGTRSNWPTLIRGARSAGQINDEGAKVLEALNTHRNHLKHRGAAVADDQRESLRAVLSTSIVQLEGIRRHG